MSNRPKTPGPDYYAMADGRQLFELEKQEFCDELERVGMSTWDSHCLLSAAEHRFRRGAKEGEELTDGMAENFWLGQMSTRGLVAAAHAGIVARIDAERKAVGR